MPNANVRDSDYDLLKVVAERTNQSQSETISQALIMYAESLGLVKTKRKEIKVVKRTYEMNDEADWADNEQPSNASH